MSERILDRVRKLMNLANDERATEGERDNALRMAHATLAKHQLDMVDVDKHVRDMDDPRGMFEMEGWNIPWCRTVRNQVAKLFNCEYFYMKINATRGKHSFVGRESNATTAMLMGDWIVKSLLKEADARYKHRLTPEGRSFGEGAAAVLRSRVHAMLKAKEEEYRASVSTRSESYDTTSGGHLSAYTLALLDEQAENAAYIEAKVGKLSVGPRRNTGVNASAYGSGVAHGKTINLNTQLTNKKGTLAIK